MSLLHLPNSRALSGHGAHRGGSPAEMRRESQKTERINCELTRALLKADGKNTRLAAENEALKARVKELGGRVVRQAADLARLRQALIQARPRVYAMPSRLDRPYIPAAVQLPYPVPVACRDTSNDTTQPLPLIDRPHAA